MNIKRSCLIQVTIVFTIIFLLGFSGSGVSLKAAYNPGWYQYRYDLQGTGVSPLKSNIVKPEIKWTYQATADIQAPPVAGDINGDGKIEIVFGTNDNHVCALDSNGNLLWTFQTLSSIVCSPAIGDINGDGKMEVVIGDFWNMAGLDAIYALNGADGSLIWKFVTPQNYEQGFQASPLLYDINGDGKLDVLIGSWDYHFYALDGPTGKIIWQSEKYEHMIKSSSPIADIDHDGIPEVVTIDNHAVTKVRNAYTGVIKWEKRIGYGVEATPLLADLNGDGYPEIVYCLFGDVPPDNGGIYVLDHNGNNIWNSTVYGDFYPSPTVVDVNGDGLKDMIAASSDTNTVIAYKGLDGTILWTRTLPNSTWLNAPLVSCDIDRDGVSEIIVGSYPNLYCLNSRDGTIKWTFLTPAVTGIWGEPIVADIDGDHNAEIIFGCSDGKLYVLQQSNDISVNVTLRVAGTKGNSLDVEIMEDTTAVANLHVLRTCGPPDEDHATFVMYSGHVYTAVVTYHAYKQGANPTWLYVNTNGYFHCFNSEKGTVQVITINL